MKIETIISDRDQLKLEVAILECETPKGIVQISHGMSEHKERYYPFMEYLKKNNFITVIHDHRGHGNSVKSKEDLGYFYEENSQYIVDDLYQVTSYIKKQYPNLPVYLFSHSMGTLVARNYLKKHDQEIEKIVLCGPPTENKLAGLGIQFAKISKKIKGDRNRSQFLNQLTFGNYNKNYKIQNEWICSNIEKVNQYNQDELSGYIFTTNGFINLYGLMKNAFNKKNWNVQNPNLKILVIAGCDDPVIQNKNKFENLINFLRSLGYKNITSKLYPKKRHELLNEVDHESIYQDILDFFNEL